MPEQQVIKKIARTTIDKNDCQNNKTLKRLSEQKSLQRIRTKNKLKRLSEEEKLKLMSKQTIIQNDCRKHNINTIFRKKNKDVGRKIKRLSKHKKH